MQPLITRDDIAKYRQISKTPHNDKLNEMILDAQILDLMPLLGEKLFNKIIVSPSDYPDLLNGGIYEVDGIEYTNYGLKMVLAYFAFARYTMFSAINDSPFSTVEKLNSDSRPADITLKKTIYNINYENAVKIFENVKNYMQRLEYPEYKYKYSQNKMRFTKIK